ncbi:unnamed protein product [Amoebophrya sp. A25]|nr:unnamed protein product [Amoebophrya sp. A25]|eukprot:GSA25T00000592001.1
MAAYAFTAKHRRLSASEDAPHVPDGSHFRGCGMAEIEMVSPAGGQLEKTRGKVAIVKTFRRAYVRLVLLDGEKTHALDSNDGEIYESPGGLHITLTPKRKGFYLFGHGMLQSRRIRLRCEASRYSETDPMECSRERFEEFRTSLKSWVGLGITGSLATSCELEEIENEVCRFKRQEDATVKPDNIVAIIGKTGVGKSAFCNAVTGYRVSPSGSSGDAVTMVPAEYSYLSASELEQLPVEDALLEGGGDVLGVLLRKELGEIPKFRASLHFVDAVTIKNTLRDAVRELLANPEDSMGRNYLEK